MKKNLLLIILPFFLSVSHGSGLKEVERLDAERVQLLHARHGTMETMAPLTHGIHDILSGHHGIDLKTYATKDQRRDVQRALLLSYFIEKNSFYTERSSVANRDAKTFFSELQDRFPPHILSDKAYEDHVNVLMYMHGAAFFLNQKITPFKMWRFGQLHWEIQHFFGDLKAFPLFNKKQAKTILGTEIVNDFLNMARYKDWRSSKIPHDISSYERVVFIEGLTEERSSQRYPLDRRWNAKYVKEDLVNGDYTPQTPLSPMPKIIHYIWVGGPIKEWYWKGILKTAHAMKDHGFVVQIWTDDPKHIQTVRDEEGCLRYQDAVFDSYFDMDGSRDFAIKNKQPHLRMRSIESIRQKEIPFLSVLGQRVLWGYMDRELVGLKNYAAFSDYFRAIILYLFGGTYLDTDVKFLSYNPDYWMDEIKTAGQLKEEGFFSRLKVDSFGWLFGIFPGFSMEHTGNNCIMQAQPRHEILRNYVETNLARSLSSDRVFRQKSSDAPTLKDMTSPQSYAFDATRHWNVSQSDLLRCHLGSGRTPRLDDVIERTGPTALVDAVGIANVTKTRSDKWFTPGLGTIGFYNGIKIETVCDNTWLGSTNPSSVTLEENNDSSKALPKTLPWNPFSVGSEHHFTVEDDKGEKSHWRATVASPRDYPLPQNDHWKKAYERKKQERDEYYNLLEYEKDCFLTLCKARWFPDRGAFLASYVYSPTVRLSKSERYLTKLWMSAGV